MENSQSQDNGLLVNPEYTTGYNSPYYQSIPNNFYQSENVANCSLSPQVVQQDTSQELVIVDKVSNGSLKYKLFGAGILVALILVSIFVLGNFAVAPENYIGINETLDEKRNNVMALATATTAAAGIAAVLPIQGSEAITAKLLELDSYILVILAVIYLEKILASTLGWCSFTFIIPAALALFAIGVFQSKGSLSRSNLFKLGSKLVAFGCALILIVPVSVGITDKIDESFSVTLQAQSAKIQENTQQLEKSKEEVEKVKETSSQQETDLIGGIVNGVQQGAANVVNGIQSIASEVAKRAQEALAALANTINTTIDTLAVMIVTSCVIPVAVLAVFLYIIKLIGGIDFGGVSGVARSIKEKSKKVADTVG